MAKTDGRGRAHRERLIRLLKRGPRRPSELGVRAWLRVLTRTVSEFIKDDLSDRAAALTYFGVLSIFPGLLVLAAGVGLLGREATRTVMVNIQELTPGLARQIINDAVENLQRSQGTASLVAIIGLGVAFWSASGYVGSFMRAANTIYDVPEGRPMWKTIPIQITVTLLTGVFLAVTSLAVFLTGRVAEVVGRLVGLEADFVRAWDYAKWPVLVILIGFLIDVLYWAGPNARQGGFRWITPGSVVAVVAWLVVSAGFAFYIAHFNSYNKTYGTLGGVIVFLVWLWLTNVAILLGAEFDAELARARAIAAGLPPHAEPYVPMRDVPPDRVRSTMDLDERAPDEVP
ncbi:MAG: YihY/virulence factor BrkB family protein [Micromonosporaceae bacterium]